jgi:hypothetical protein
MNWIFPPAVCDRLCAYPGRPPCPGATGVESDDDAGRSLRKLIHTDTAEELDRRRRLKGKKTAPGRLAGKLRGAVAGQVKFSVAVLLPSRAKYASPHNDDGCVENEG